MSDTTDTPAVVADYVAPVRMDPTDKARWLGLLRSGSFKQGESALFNLSDQSFCCLGVLRLVTDSPRWDDGELLDAEYCGINLEIQGHLAGANDGCPVTIHGLEPVPHNTGPKSTFAEIADWVEKWL